MVMVQIQVEGFPLHTVGKKIRGVAKGVRWSTMGAYLAIESMKHRVARAICNSTATMCLSSFAIVVGLRG